MRSDCGLAWVEEEVDLAGEIALETADDLALGVALGGLLRYVGLGVRLLADPADDGEVEGSVGLPVAAAVEPVSLGRHQAKLWCLSDTLTSS